MRMLNGNGDMLSNIDLGYKSNYWRMNSEAGECNDDSVSHDYQNSKVNSSRKYVMANAFFASLNSVLLGYGMFLLHMLRSCQRILVVFATLVLLNLNISPIETVVILRSRLSVLQG